MKKDNFDLIILSKLREKYQVRCEREIVRGEKKLINEYISVYDVVSLLKDFLHKGEAKS